MVELASGKWIVDSGLKRVLFNGVILEVFLFLFDDFVNEAMINLLND